MSEVNLFAVEPKWDEDDPAGYTCGYVRVGPLVGASQLGLSVYELPPGNSVCPYHYEVGIDEWLIVLAGRPTLRTPEGERERRPVGRCVLPARRERGAQGDEQHGRDGARRDHVDATRARPSRSIRTRTRSASGRPASCSRLDSAVDYFHGEP